MTNQEMTVLLRDMVGNETDSVLSTYLSIACDAILNRLYPYARIDEELSVPIKYQMLQVEIAAFLLNKRGAEGQTRHSENGIVRYFGSADIPDDMLSRIVPYVGVIGG